MKRPEQALQQQVARFINQAAPGLLWWHVPNSSGNRGPKLGGILKSMGVKAGVPDLVFVLPTGRAGFIELKAGTGKLTDSQKDFRDRVTDAGAFWAEARSVAEVEDILHRWLTPFGWKLQARVSA